MAEKNQNVSQSRSLSHTERQAVEKMSARRFPNRDIFKPVDRDDQTSRKVEPVYARGLSEKDAEDEFQSRIYAATGAASQQVGLNLLANASEALSKKDEPIEESVRKLNTVAKAMQALEPRDEVEGQLAAQLTVLHEHCMSWLSRAMKTERVDFANTYLNGASKLLTRHHETLDAHLKYRRRGEQRVYVEHVHVHDGGRAIVGNIGTGGGLNQKVEEGPHAKV